MIESVPFKLTADIIEGFSGSVLSPNYDEAAPTPKAHLEWWELCCSNFRRVAIAAPRGHAKSTAITKAYLLAAVLFRERRHVVIVSDTYKQSVQFLGEAKRELEVNEQIKELFGPYEFTTDREEEVVVKFTDGYNFRIVSLGSEQKVRGIIWNNRRPDLIIGDDLENDEIVMNPDRRDKFQKWLDNALLPCMAHKGVIRLVGTILHMDSALENVMPKDRSANTIHTELKSYMKRPVDGWMSVRYKAHNEDFSHLLWPIKWSEKKFRELRSTFIGSGNPEGYYQEYLNRPMDPTNTFFKKTDLQDFDQFDLQRGWEYSPTYLAMDGAFSTRERRDWCAFTIGSLDESGMLYIRHVIRERLDTKEVVDTITRLQERYKFTTCLIGKGSYEKGIGPFLKDEINRRKRFLHMELIPEVIDKRLRAQSIRGRMRAGGVKFLKQAHWFPVFEQELLEFDRGKHDDQVDTMSLFGLYLDKMMSAPDSHEVRLIEQEEEFGSFPDLNVMDGITSTTGYDGNFRS